MQNTRWVKCPLIAASDAFLLTKDDGGGNQNTYLLQEELFPVLERESQLHLWGVF